MNEKTKKKTLTYLLAFTIPLVIRAIPELKYKYPLGADTPFYMYTIKYGKIPPLIMDIWRQNNIYYTLLAYIGKTGINPELFFKIYPPIIFALTILGFVAYADIKLKWKPRDLIILSTTMTLTPALLRLSWDLHRQNFATLILAWTIVLQETKLPWKIKTPTTLLALLTIAFTHELIFAIAITVIAWNIIGKIWKQKTFSRKKKATLTIATLLILAIPVIAYVMLKPQIFQVTTKILRSKYYISWKHLDTILTFTILSYGPILPLAALGVFHSNLTTPWTILLTASLAILTPLNRIIHTLSYPLSVYAANTVRKLNPRKTAPYLTLMVLLIQPLSMLGAFPLPITIYAGERYGSFTDLLAPSIPEEKIEALQYFKQYIEKQSKIKTIGFHPSYLSGWISYIYGNYNLKYYPTTLAWARKGKTLYYISFNDHRNPMLKYKNINQTKIATYKELALYILNPK